MFSPSRSERQRSGKNGEADCLILLVEDNPGDANLVREALQEHKIECEVIHCVDGEQAIECIERVDSSEARCPDLLILDINVPRKPGTAVLERMRASSACSDVPVIVLTSSNDHKDRAAAERLGASRYVQKPSRLVDFLNLGIIFKDAIKGRLG